MSRKFEALAITLPTINNTSQTEIRNSLKEWCNGFNPVTITHNEVDKEEQPLQSQRINVTIKPIYIEDQVNGFHSISWIIGKPEDIKAGKFCFSFQGNGGTCLEMVDRLPHNPGAYICGDYLNKGINALLNKDLIKSASDVSMQLLANPAICVYHHLRKQYKKALDLSIHALSLGNFIASEFSKKINQPFKLFLETTATDVDSTVNYLMWYGRLCPNLLLPDHDVLQMLMRKDIVVQINNVDTDLVITKKAQITSNPLFIQLKHNNEAFYVNQFTHFYPPKGKNNNYSWVIKDYGHGDPMLDGYGFLFSEAERSFIDERLKDSQETKPSDVDLTKLVDEYIEDKIGDEYVEKNIVRTESLENSSQASTLIHFNSLFMDQLASMNKIYLTKLKSYRQQEKLLGASNE